MDVINFNPFEFDNFRSELMAAWITMTRPSTNITVDQYLRIQGFKSIKYQNHRYWISPIEFELFMLRYS